MRFKNIGIVGAGPNCVFTLDVIIKRILKNKRDGYFVEPTLFDQVDPSTPLAYEETFGPVASVVTFESEDEALSIANKLDYGLVAGLYTRDINRALNLTRRLECGSVWINGWFIGGVQAPTGGVKDSGVGVERGLAGVHNYLRIKNVGIRL